MTVGSYHAFDDVCYDPDPTTGHDAVMKAQDARQVLETVIANDGRELSAHDTFSRLHHDAEIRFQVANAAPAAWATSPGCVLAPDSISGAVLDGSVVASVGSA